MDWKPTLGSYLRVLPGRNGVPLSYIIRPETNRVEIDSDNVLEEYIAGAPFTGNAYTSDNRKVFEIIQRLIIGNAQAESIVRALNKPNDGRSAYMAIKVFYEGEGVMSMEVIKAEKDLHNLFYSGEKHPNMWFILFEQRLKTAFATLDRLESRQVFSNHMKLRKLQEKIKADFLQPHKVTIDTELAKVPMRK